MTRNLHAVPDLPTPEGPPVPSSKVVPIRPFYIVMDGQTWKMDSESVGAIQQALKLQSQTVTVRVFWSPKTSNETRLMTVRVKAISAWSAEMEDFNRAKNPVP